MNIADLDEAEGLTREMFRDWLTRNGWKELETVRKGSVKWSHWTGTCLGTVADGRLSASIEALAGHYRRSPQAILREMNPRMKSGIPTDQEIEAHRSKSGAGWPWPWLAHDEHGNPRVGFWSRPMWQQTGPYSFYVQGRGYLTQERVKAWSFWPADRNLARVPWPPIAGGEGRR